MRVLVILRPFQQSFSHMRNGIPFAIEKISAFLTARSAGQSYRAPANSVEPNQTAPLGAV